VAQTEGKKWRYAVAVIAIGLMVGMVAAGVGLGWLAWQIYRDETSRPR
jgi:hypothetical protein